MALDLSGLTVDTMPASAILQKPLVQNETITRIANVVPGIKGDQKVALGENLRKITRADSGCGQGDVGADLTLTEKTWTPKAMRVEKRFCASDVETYFIQWGLATGKDYYDLQKAAQGSAGNPLFVAWAMDVIGKAAANDMLRIALLGDTSADNISGGGNLTNGIAAADYTMLNGWIQQIKAYPGYSSIRYTISENAGGSYAAQALTAGESENIFRGLYKTVSPRVKGASDRVILCSQSVYDDWLFHIVDKDRRNSTSENFTNFYGATVIPLPVYDEARSADFDTATVLYEPHFALMTTKSMLGIGFDDAGQSTPFMFFDPASEKLIIRKLYKMDAKALAPELMAIAI